MAVRRRQHRLLAHAEKAGVGALGQGAVGQIEQGLQAAGFLGGLHGQDIGQQVGRLDVAAAPAQVRLGDHRGPIPAGCLVRVDELVHVEEFQRRGLDGKFVRAGSGTARDLDVDGRLPERPRRDGVPDPFLEPVQVDAVDADGGQACARRAKCSSSSQGLPW